jgi:hypothetical protein
MEEFPEKMLAESGQGATRTGSSNDRDREINVDSFFQSEWFHYCGSSATREYFTAQYFIDQILKPLSQESSTKSVDIARRSLRLHFDNSRCHTAKIVSEKMTCLNCKRAPHPLYSPDLTIEDFYLFGVLKKKLQGIDVSDDEDLKSEILTISQGIPSDELTKSFDHWIERCQWVIANAGNYYPS